MARATEAAQYRIVMELSLIALAILERGLMSCSSRVHTQLVFV